MFIAKHIEQSKVSILNTYFRKYAHGTVYLALSVLVLIALNRSGMKGFKTLAASFLFCALYASSDEFHQLFVKGRGAQVSDILIDCIGALSGIVLFTLFSKVFNHLSGKSY